MAILKVKRLKHGGEAIQTEARARSPRTERILAMRCKAKLGIRSGRAR